MLSMTMDKQKKQLKTRNCLRDWLITIKMMVKWLDDLRDFYYEKYCKDGKAKKKFQEDAEMKKDLKKIRKAVKESIGEI